MFKYIHLRKLKAGLINVASKAFSAKKEGNRLSFIEKLKEKFSIKPEEKIIYSELKNKNEEEDNLKATKFENEEDFEDLVDNRNTSYVNLDIEKINSEIEFVSNTQSLENQKIKVDSLKYLESKYNLNANLFYPHVKKAYEQADNDLILQNCDSLKKLNFSDSQIKILIQKS